MLSYKRINWTVISWYGEGWDGTLNVLSAGTECLYFVSDGFVERSSLKTSETVRSVSCFSCHHVWVSDLS